MSVYVNYCLLERYFHNSCHPVRQINMCIIVIEVSNISKNSTAQICFWFVDNISLASWVECETIYLWVWSFCARGRGFTPRPWDYSRRSFSSNQATGKVFSTEHAIYSKFQIYLKLVSVGEL